MHTLTTSPAAMRSSSAPPAGGPTTPSPFALNLPADLSPTITNLIIYAESLYIHLNTHVSHNIPGCRKIFTYPRSEFTSACSGVGKIQRSPRHRSIEAAPEESEGGNELQ